MAAITILNVIPSVSSLVLIVLSLAIYLAFYLTNKLTYWERRGVPHVPFGVTFNVWMDLLFRRVPLTFIFERIYKELDGYKFGGFYRMTKATVMIRDPEIIKTVLVKNFSNFHDRTAIPVDEKIDPLASNLVNLTGQRWRNIRYKLVPAFSSGKLRQMEAHVRDCVSELDDYLMKTTGQDSKTSDIVNVNELMAKFTTDVIGTCAFGFQCNSIKDEDSEFRRIGRLLFAPSFQSHIRNLLSNINPQIIKLLKIKTMKLEIEEFFKSILEQAIKHRETSTQKRNDFLQLMIDIQAAEKANLQSNGNKQNGHQQNGTLVEQDGQSEKSDENPSGILFTEGVVVSNALSFFSAGFEPTASTLSYCLYELALNSEICEKMRDEVESVKRVHNGNLDYTAMKELIYMEAVISETLRKYPVAPALGRRCNESFQVPGSSIVIQEGDFVVISIQGLHHDPKYFPEPEKFLPERFSKESKKSIVPGSYLPFGDGPRMCIGMRFAQLEMKAALAYLVSNYTFHPCEKTAIPLKFDRRALLLSATGGIWVRFQKRSKS